MESLTHQQSGKANVNERGSVAKLIQDLNLETDDPLAGTSNNLYWSYGRLDHSETVDLEKLLAEEYLQSTGTKQKHVGSPHKCKRMLDRINDNTLEPELQ
jgi:hypothetical protein